MMGINSWRYMILVNFLLFKLNKVWLFAHVLSCWNKPIAKCVLGWFFKEAWLFLLHLKCKRTHWFIFYLGIWVILFFLFDIYWIKVLRLFVTDWCTKGFWITVWFKGRYFKAFEQISFDRSLFWTEWYVAGYYRLRFHVVKWLLCLMEKSWL